MKKHKDLEFAVNDRSGQQKIFKTFDAACGFAVAESASSGLPWDVDVLAYSRAAARAFAGDSGAEQYDGDPEASVFNRIRVRADDQGRIA